MTTENITPTILKTDSLGRVETPLDERERLLDLYEQSGMTGAGFARFHGIRYTTFAHWRRVRRRKCREEAEANSPAVFQEAVISVPSHREEGLQVELPLGTRVIMSNPNQIPLIAALARHLKESESC